MRADKGKKNYLRGINQKGNRTKWKHAIKNPDALPEPLTPEQRRRLVHLGEPPSDLVDDRYGISPRCYRSNDGVWRQG